MKAKRILLISHNFFPEPIGIGKYNGEMVDWMAKAGHDCTVITTFPHYPFWKVQAPYTNRWYKTERISYPERGTSTIICRCPSYIPRNPTGGCRTVQDLSYLLSKFFVVARLMLDKEKFDLIITVAPPFHLAYLGLMLRSARGGKLLYHIQDLQIEAARDLKLFSNRAMLRLLFALERHIFHSADHISSISEGMISRIRTKTTRDIFLFPNWVDTGSFYPLSGRKDLKCRWDYSPGDTVCLYSGAAGVKQGLEQLLDAAAILLVLHKEIKFVICSSGPYKERLARQAWKRGLTNVAFLPLQDKAVFNEFLNMADLHLVLQKASASDLVMPSKLSAILAVGGASIITANKGTTLYEMIQSHRFGYIVKPGNAVALAEKILEAMQDETLEQKRGNARQYALEHLNMDKIMRRFEETFLE